jgi:hypothetical protein
VAHCIGRAVYGFPLIELEVTCLAFIACNIGMYVFWWYSNLAHSRCPATASGLFMPLKRTLAIG